MPDRQEVRDKVSKDYAAKITGTGGGCCGGADTQVAKLAGYGADDLTHVPDDVAGSSFGCGNPLAFSEVGPGQTVLDLGSGAGMDLLIAAEKVGPEGKVIGIDMTDEMIAKARENIEKSGHANIEVRKGIIEELPVESGTVDWVISNCVINLSPEKDKVFAEIARVLKPGGRISISDIVVKEMPEWVLKSDILYSSCVAGAIDEEAYVEGLRKAGLGEVVVANRLVYDASQLQWFVLAEVLEKMPASACCSGVAESELPKQVSESLTGKIWSAKFQGVKVTN